MTTDRRDVVRTPTVVADSWRLFAMLSALYFAQGLPSGLIAKALPVLLREQGVSLSVIGFTSALALPWALKFAWAPFVDRYGSRKRWLLVLNCVTMGLMLLVASRDFAAWVDALPLLLAVLFCMNLVSATQDIATDGYAVSTLKPEWRGLGNSIQVVGYKLGMVVGSGALLWLTARQGWQMSYGSLACLMLLVILPVLFMDDLPAGARQAATHTQWHGVRGYVRLFRDFVMRPGLGWWLLTVALYKFGDSLGSRMTGRFSPTAAIRSRTSASLPVPRARRRVFSAPSSAGRRSCAWDMPRPCWALACCKPWGSQDICWSWVVWTISMRSRQSSISSSSPTGSQRSRCSRS